MALDRLTKVDGGGISTTSDYRVGIITASKFVGPFDGTGGNFSGIITATGANFSGNVSIGGTLTYEDVTNIDSVGIITARNGIDCNGDIDVDGHTNLDNVSVAGVTTFASSIHVADSIIHEGDTDTKIDFDGNRIKLTAGNKLYGDIGLSAYNWFYTATNFVANSSSPKPSTYIARFRDEEGDDMEVQFFNTNVKNSILTWNDTGNTTAAGNLIFKGIAGGSGLEHARFTGSGNFNLLRDLDVDGHTNLDNVNIAGVTTTSDHIYIKADNKKIFLGASQELSLWHNGTDSFIKHTPASGGLYMGGKIVSLNNQAASRYGIAYFENPGDARLYWSGTDHGIRLKTTQVGINISLDLDVDGHTNLDNVSVAGVTTFYNNVRLLERDRLQLGNSQEFQIYYGLRDYNNTDDHAVIRNSTGNLYIQEDSHIVFETPAGDDMASMSAGDAVKLFFNGTQKFQTTNTGFDGSGSSFNLQTSDSGSVNLRLQNSSTGTGTNDGFLIQLDSNEDGYIWHRENQDIIFGTADTTRWKIDNNGHFLPGTPNAYNIGSASLEIGDIYFANSKGLKLGSNQAGDLYNDGTDTYFRNSASNGQMLLRSNGNILISNYAADEYRIKTFNNGAVELYYDQSAHATAKLATTATGVSVHGEVAASQDYPNFRPVLDFNFAATKKLKPEMTFARVGEASFHDGVGSVKFVSDNEPRFEHDIVTGECKGLMFEGAGTNYSWYSRRFDVSATASWIKVTGNLNVVANSHNAPDGTSSGDYMADTVSGANGNTFNGNVLRQQITAGANVKHTFSIYIKLLTSTQATIYIRDGATGSTSTANAISNTRNWQRVVVTSNNALTNGTTHSFYIGNTNGDIAVWGSQIERSDYVTSYIKTDGGANGTRNTDKGVHLDGEDVTDVFNQGEGTLIAETILTQSLSNNPIVGFYEDFGSHNRLELRGDASSVGTARFEAVVGGSSVTSLTTNLQHSGVNNVSKYAYAFQENNYAGCVNGGSVTTDTSSTFPHGTGINSMMIGEAVYQVDGAVIVKRIMYYADRLPNSQLVTLTS